MPAEAGVETIARVDGRAARAEKTRQAIVDALLGLLEEGELQPTATRIAERAGISLRLIYHHFGDLESLFRATTIRQGERLADMSEPIDRTLPFPERLDAFCNQRSRLLEWITPVRRAALLHEPFSPELRRARDAMMRASETQIAELFGPELDRSDEPARSELLNSICTLAGWNAWEAMRTRGLSESEAHASMHRGLAVLLGEQG